MKRNKIKSNKIKGKKRKKYYIILSKKEKFQYGVFPYSKEGLQKARVYLNKITTKPELYTIKSR